MHNMRHRRRLATLCAVAGMALGAAGCSTEDASRDKAGGPGDPVVLKMATVNGDLKFTPQVRYFVDRVKELSDGNLRIEVAYEVGAFTTTRSSRSSAESPTTTTTSGSSARRSSTRWASPASRH